MAEGYFNADLTGQEGSYRDEEIAVALATTVLEDILEHYILQQFPWTRDSRTWIMVRWGREVQSQMYYILVKDLCIFMKMSDQEPRHNLYHYLILGCLHSATLKEHAKYLRRSMRIPLRPLTTPTRKDGLFTALRQAIPNPKYW